MWEAVGFQVSRLKRTRYGSVELPRLLKRGKHDELAPAVVEQMRAELSLTQNAGVLTLQPVIGQRRAKASEYKPGPREQRAWTNETNGDEGRELRAFDNLRDERSARPKSRFGAKPARKGGARPGGPGGAKAGAGARRGPGRNATGETADNRGNRLTAPGGTQANAGRPRRGREGAAPGFENPNEFRSWYVPEGVTTTSRVAPPRNNGGKPGYKPEGNGPRPQGPGKPGGNRAPGNRPAGSSPYAGPGGNRGKEGGQPRGGNRGRPGGKPKRGGPGPSRGS
jgi:23S rRNA pseudouridine2605 synthase